MAVGQAAEQRLTPKGLATRERIVEAAAKLVYEHGVQNTNNELVRKEAGVSGSQLSRHFPTKEALIRAVVAWRADVMIESHQSALGRVDSLAALRRWADSFIAREELSSGGCPFGSLVSEVIKTGFDLRGSLVQGFEEWRGLFRSGLQTMRDSGELRAEADPDQLAYTLAAAFQGGMLLDQTVGNAEPLRAALKGALAYIDTFSAGAPEGTPAE
ncbi:TetR/AcrR family transcriptional regulator [Streptomyces sp. ME03-5709C]|nr:TetR/AcrR family transcriptional regulator [Streptomyces sp. ME03-5709C]